MFLWLWRSWDISIDAPSLHFFPPFFSPLFPLGCPEGDSLFGLWFPTQRSLRHAQLPSQPYPAQLHDPLCTLSSPIAALALMVLVLSGILTQMVPAFSERYGTSFLWEMSFHTTSITALFLPQTCFSLYGRCLQCLTQLNQYPRNVLVACGNHKHLRCTVYIKSTGWNSVNLEFVERQMKIRLEKMFAVVYEMLLRC